MALSPVHRDRCLGQINLINTVFQAYGQDFDELLKQLTALPNIGLVISSGIIFSVNRNSMVPFDKFTTGWAIELEIIPNARISSNNYVVYSKKIVNYVDGSKHLKTIVDFVREAREKARFPIPPE